RLAGEGWPIGPDTLRTLSRLGRSDWFTDEWKAVFLTHLPQHPGGLYRLPHVARLFERLAEGGRDDFYTGEIARDTVRAVQRAVGLLRIEDLARQASIVTEPISSEYRGCEVFQTPPNSQGAATLVAMQVYQRLCEAPFSDIGLKHAESLRLHRQMC